MSDNNNTSSGIGFIGLLQIVFIVLKLVGVIEWAWPIVFMPFIIGTILTIVVIGIVLIIAFSKE